MASTKSSKASKPKLPRKAALRLNAVETELAALPNIGPYSAKILHAVGITSASDFHERDPYELYEAVVEYSVEPVNRLMLKAIVGAQRGVHWQQVSLSKDGKAIVDGEVV